MKKCVNLILSLTLLLSITLLNVAPTYANSDDDLYFSTHKYKQSEKDGKYGLTDASGNVIIPYIYEFIGLPNSETSLLIAQNSEGLWGVINLKNEVVAPFIYERTFQENMGSVVTPVMRHVLYNAFLRSLTAAIVAE